MSEISWVGGIGVKFVCKNNVGVYGYVFMFDFSDGR